MKPRYLAATLIAFVALAASSCAVDRAEDSDAISQKILDAWIKVNYGDNVKQTASGAYILEFEQGTGDLVGDSSYVFSHYVKTDLSGNVSSTNSKELNQKIGAFSYADYYGCNIWRIGQGSIFSGVEELMKTMRVGGRAKLALPPKATAIDSTTIYRAFSAPESNCCIFEFTVEKIVEDITKYQWDMLEEYSRTYCGGIDSIGEGFYLYKIKECTEATDTIPDGTTIKVNYIGRRLDNSVFDTNIQDSSKFYRLYSSDGTYDPLDVEFYSDIESMAEKNSDYIAGYTYALHRMNYGEKAIAFFASPLGYGDTGSSTSIPEYCPLCFYLEVEEKD